MLLDGRAAERCPVALDAEVVGISPEQPSDVVVKWRDAAQAHRADVIGLLQVSNPDLVVIEGADFDARVAATTAAIARGASLIVAPRIADDLEGMRRGWPDLLVRSASGYLPVLVKRHRVAEITAAGRSLSSTLERPFYEDAVLVHGRKLGKIARRDGSELAHLIRLCQAAGLPVATTGGVVDADGAMWWMDTAAPRPGGRSLLERYDDGFAFARRVTDRAVARRDNSDLAPLVIPLHKAECSRCGFEQRCRAEMEAADSVSLLPGMQWRHALEHVESGRGTRALLADLDPRTAHVAHIALHEDPSLDLGSLVAQARSLDGETPVAHLLGEHLATRRAMRKAGVVTAQDLATLDDTTLAYKALAGSNVKLAIERARAAISKQPFFISGRREATVPRADLEIDLDMEHADGGTYLWGAVVTSSSAVPPEIAALSGSYEAFVDFDPLGDVGEVRLVRELLDWIAALTSAAEAVGATWLVAFYSHAEIDELRRIAKLSGDHELIARVEHVAKSPNWVDLRIVVEDNLVVGHGFSLKKLAPYAGFSWRDEDPSGSASMTWYDKAVGADTEVERVQNQQRLLAYNEDDCRATLALRQWLSTAPLTCIDDWKSPALGQ